MGTAMSLMAGLQAAPAPFQVVAECTPMAGHAGARVGARILSNGLGGEVRAIVYDMLDAGSPRSARQERQQGFPVNDASGDHGTILYSASNFYLMVKPHAGGYIAGLSTRFEGRILREKLECEFSEPRARIAYQVLRDRKSVARR